jgi:beta-galactosidase beta subunit
MAKRLNKYGKMYDLPKPLMRKIRKISKTYNLNLTATLYLIEASAKKYYNQMSEMTNKLEKELKDDK